MALQRKGSKSSQSNLNLVTPVSHRSLAAYTPQPDRLFVLHNVDLKKAFGVESNYDVGDDVGDDGESMCLMICMHCIFSLSFLGHAVFLWLVGPWSRMDFGENICAAALYMSAGVIFPGLRRSVEHSLPLVRVISVAKAMDADEFHSTAGGFLEVSKRLWPVLLALGVWAPILVWIPHVYPACPMKALFGCNYGALVLTSLVAWESAMLVFGPAKLDNVGLSAAECMVDAVVKRINEQTPSEDVPGDFNDEWHGILTMVRAVDAVLFDICGFSSIGGLTLVRILLSIFSALVLYGVSTVHKLEVMRTLCRVYATLLAFLGTSLLWRFGRLTHRCCGNEPGQNSIASAVCGRMLGGDVHNESIYRSDLQFFLAYRPFGARLGGIIITQKLVLIVGLRTCVYLPIATTFVGAFMQGKPE